MEKGDFVVYEGTEYPLEERWGDWVKIKTGSISHIECHISHLGPRDGITTEELFLTKSWLRRLTRMRIEKKVKNFFRELLTLSVLPTRQLLVNVTLDKDMSSQFIMDILNQYGVYGCAGAINIHYEWKFRRPTYSDHKALEIMRYEERQHSDFLCDIGARGRRHYYAGTKDIKDAWFLGEVIDLRLYRSVSKKVA